MGREEGGLYMTAPQQPMAFFHVDGNVPAWVFAMKYAGPDGHIATLPEIIEARLATKREEVPWQRYFTTNTAEYYGIGADGRPKMIVAHGVGPMSTIDGIKKAYKWEYGDKTRRNNGGRIPISEFLKLEAGEYGEAVKFDLRDKALGSVVVVDLLDYLEVWKEAFYQWHDPFTARLDKLLWARLGPRTGDYLSLHDKYASLWHTLGSIKLPQGGRPMIIHMQGASNCPYTTSPMVNGMFDWRTTIPHPVEDGLAMGHLLSISGLAHSHCGGWQGLTCDVYCHEWWNGTRFVGVQEGADWKKGILDGPRPDVLVRQQWQRFMVPNNVGVYFPPRLYLLEKVGNEWFTRYAKPIDVSSMDSGDIEFRVRSITPVGEDGQFQVDEDFFLRYDIGQVLAIAPDGANAYEIVDYTSPDSKGITTVTVRFFQAVVDISQRLPRFDEIKQNYDLLMG
jgi:hypothetical protein